jgi:hypothetical protein
VRSRLPFPAIVPAVSSRPLNVRPDVRPARGAGRLEAGGQGCPGHGGPRSWGRGAGQAGDRGAAPYPTPPRRGTGRSATPTSPGPSRYSTSGPPASWRCSTPTSRTRWRCSRRHPEPGRRAGHRRRRRFRGVPRTAAGLLGLPPRRRANRVAVATAAAPDRRITPSAFSASAFRSCAGFRSNRWTGRPACTGGACSSWGSRAQSAPPTADDDRVRHRSGVRSTSLAGFLSTYCRNATPPPHRRARPTSRATPAALPGDRAGQQRPHSGESR